MFNTSLFLILHQALRLFLYGFLFDVQHVTLYLIQHKDLGLSPLDR